MICPECHCRISPSHIQCPACGRRLTQTEIKKSKRRRRIAFWIPLGLFLGVLAAVALAIILPAPYVKTITLNSDELEYLDPLTVAVTCENLGLINSDFIVPVYIDEQEAASLSFFLSGGEEKRQNAVFSIDDLSGPGGHTLRIGTTQVPFSYLSPAELSLSYKTGEKIFAAGEPYQIAFSVSNTGPSSGEFSFSVSIEDTVFEQDTFLVKAGKAKDRVTTIAYDTPGDYMLKINDDAFPVSFYAVGTLSNGQKLTKSTLSGYSYFDITNSTAQDVVFYVSRVDSPDTAVAAQCIKAGEHYKVRSFPHGEYYMFIQTGNLWLPDAGRFGKDEKIYQSAEVAFDNSSDGRSQYYQYLTLELNPGNFTRYFDRTNQLPALPE